MYRRLPEGHTVEISYGETWFSPEGRRFDRRRRYTQVIIYDSSGNYVAEAVAVCNPRDNFSKKIGRDIALGRALKDLGIHSNELNG